MREELDEALWKKYPKIFKYKTGIECSDGWFDLIDKLCFDIQEYTDCDPEMHPQVRAIQIKEKFGGLRFYVESAANYQHNLIEKAENESYKICELCGSKDKVGQTRGGWITTLCKRCANLHGHKDWKYEN